MEKSTFLSLIDKYLNGTASAAEKRLIREYYSRLEESSDGLITDEEGNRLKELMLSNIRDSIQQEGETSKIKTGRAIPLWLPYIAAACLIAVMATALIFYQGGSVHSEKHPLGNTSLEKNDVGPGGNKAILTLADGTRIVLDDVKSGEIAKQTGISISKTADGLLVYSISSKKPTGKPTLTFNKIETPRGGQYQINLPDGSKVWLNAESALKFPTVFYGNERIVELEGEAYFEIVSNKSMPFKVEASNQVVEVFGTHFNINSYSNESGDVTTLLEGSVKVTDRSIGKARILSPGQAAVSANGTISVKEANMEQAVSWKDGAFIFNDMYLTAIMRQLERWYDIEVDYSSLPVTRFNVHVSKDLKLSSVLKTLEVTGKIKFKIEDRKIRAINTIPNIKPM